MENNKLKIAFAVLCLLVYANRLTAQTVSNYSINHFGLKEGLPSNQTTCLLKDKKGYVWIGTANGLARYDGYKFETFRHQTNNVNSIKSNDINCLQQSSDGKILIGHVTEGLTVFNPVTETFTNYCNNELAKKIPGVNKINAIAEANNQIWFCTETNGLGCIDEKTKAFNYFLPDTASLTSSQKYYSKVFTSMCVDTINNLLITSSYGLHYFNTKTKKVQSYYNLYDARDKVNINAFISVIANNDNTFWVGSWGYGMCKLNLNSQSFSPIEIKSNATSLNVIRNIVRISSDKLLIGLMSDGCAIYNETKNTTEFIKHNASNTNSISSDEVKAVLADNENNYWIATEKGIDKIDASENVMANVKIPEQYFVNKNLTSISDYCYNAKTKHYFIALTYPKKFLEFDAEKNIFYPYDIEEKGNKVSDLLSLRNIITINDDSLLVVALNGLYLFDKKNKRLRQLEIKTRTNLPFTNLSEMIKEYQYEYWVLAYQHFGKVNLLTKEFISVPLAAAEKLNQFDIYSSICRVSQNLFFMSGSNGVARFDISTNKYEVLTSDSESDCSAKRIGYGNICRTRSNRFFMGSTGQGLIEIKNVASSNPCFTKLGNEIGLQDNNTNNLVADINDNVWMTTGTGIAKYDCRQNKFYNYNFSDRIDFENLNFNFPSSFDSTLVFFNGNTVYSFTENNAQKIFDVPVVLTSFKTINSEWKSDSVAGFISVFSLPATANTFTFSFAALSFNEGNRIQYAYKLVGLNSDWNLCGANREASYANLEPGKYELWITAIDKNGEWNKQIKKIAIIIAKPFYKTKLFLFLSLAVILFLTWLIFRLRVKALLKKQQLKSAYENKIVELEANLLRSQMNPHFIFNSLNSISNYIVKEDKKEAVKYLGRFSKLIRNILDNSKNKLIPLEKELETVQLYFEMENMRFENRLHFHLQISSNINPETVLIPPTLMQPHVENAIWHGLRHKTDGGNISIEISCTEKHLVCKIKDDGVGRDAAKKIETKTQNKLSYGSAITKDRLEALGNDATTVIEDLKNENNEPTGTLVTLYIPLMQSV
jgi:ligand-binding sensor domain-containing protein